MFLFVFLPKTNDLAVLILPQLLDLSSLCFFNLQLLYFEFVQVFHGRLISLLQYLYLHMQLCFSFLQFLYLQQKLLILRVRFNGLLCE